MLRGWGDPVSDCVGDIGVAVWIALGRAHQGGVTNLAGQWLDCDHPVPGYVADALDRLTSSGQLALTDPDPQSCGARRVTVTDTGCANYVTLCQIHDSRATVSVDAPRRWACSPHDQHSHLPVIDSPEAAGQALGELFLANADRGDDAANDHLVTELVRRIRAQQHSRDGGATGGYEATLVTPQLPTPQFGPDGGVLDG